MDEYIGIRFGRVTSEDGEVEWRYFPHTDYDGIGAFVEIFRENGVEVGDLPRITHPGAPSWWPLIRSVPKTLGPRRRLIWRVLKSGPQIETIQQPAPAVAWHVFDDHQTAEICRMSRSTGVTVNSFLLKQLDRSIRPYLSDPSSATPWMVPVNLRGKVNLPKDTENHSSYVAIRINPYETAQQVHQSLYRKLRKGEHWANWKSFSLGSLFSKKLKKWLINHDRAASQWNLGCFSNLGVWDWQKEITQKECLGPWLFCPPVLRCQMIGAGCVTFQNRLSITIQVHPDLTTAPEIVEDWIRAWSHNILLPEK